MQVTIVKKQGLSVLVEYEDENGRLCRVIVPCEEVSQTGEISLETLAMGIPYGLDWDSILDVPVPVTVTELSDALRREGLWTWADVSKESDKIPAVLMKVFSIRKSAIVTAAKNKKEV